MLRLNSEKHFFPVDIFRCSNGLFYSESDAKYHDIKILSLFPGNPFLKILIENCYCVGGTNMRECFLMKIYLIAIYDYPVILTYL